MGWQWDAQRRLTTLRNANVRGSGFEAAPERFEAFFLVPKARLELATPRL
jgi:hypothetical protein